MPITSICRSCVISPTIATTFEVPISRPTTKLRSGFLAILSFIPILYGCANRRDARLVLRAVGRFARQPTDSEAIAVTHVDVGHVVGLRCHHRTRCTNESF